MKLLKIICETNVPNIELLNRTGFDVYYDEKNDVYAMEKKVVVLSTGDIPWTGGSGTSKF